MCLLGTSEKRILKVFVWKAPRKIGRHARRQMTNGNRKTPSSSANSEDRNENSTVAGKLLEDSPGANWFAATAEDVVASIIRLILEIPKCPAKTIVAVYQRTVITLSFTSRWNLSSAFIPFEYSPTDRTYVFDDVQFVKRSVEGFDIEIMIGCSVCRDSRFSMEIYESARTSDRQSVIINQT